MNIHKPTLTFTISFIVVGALIITGVDLYFMHTVGREATISYVIISLAYDYPAIPLVTGLVIGFLLGHLFWMYKGVNPGLEKNKLKGKRA